MKLFISTVVFLSFSTTAISAVKTLDEVIQKRLSTASTYTSNLAIVAKRDRIRAWLPTAPLVEYSVNDNNSWKAYSVSTMLPIPFKSMYRDNVEVAKAQYLAASAEMNKQTLLRETIENFLECSIPSEMSKLLELALDDQRVVSTISNSLYSSGLVPQADRVAAELLVRQLEAQVRMQKDQAHSGCFRWEKWADESNNEAEVVYFLPDNISDPMLVNLGLAIGKNRDVMAKNLMRISLEKSKLWSKYVPDLNLSFNKNNYFDLFRSGGPPVKDTTSWSVGITLPFTFPFYDNSDYRREKAELGLDSLKAELELNNAEKNWIQAKSDWERATNRLREISTKDLALSEVLVESSLASYRSGKVGFADLVLARRTRLDLKIEEMQLKAQRLIAKSVCLTECE